MASPGPRSSNGNSPTANPENAEAQPNEFRNRSGTTTRSQGTLLSEFPEPDSGLHEAACTTTGSSAGAAPGQSAVPLHAGPPTNSSNSTASAVLETSAPGTVVIPGVAQQADSPTPALQRANGAEHLGSTAIDTVEQSQTAPTQEVDASSSISASSPTAAAAPVLQTPPPKSNRQPAEDALTPLPGQSESAASAQAIATPKTKVRSTPPPPKLRSSGGKRLFGAALKAKEAKREREARKETTSSSGGGGDGGGSGSKRDKEKAEKSKIAALAEGQAIKDMAKKAPEAKKRARESSGTSRAGSSERGPTRSPTPPATPISSKSTRKNEKSPSVAEAKQGSPTTTSTSSRAVTETPPRRNPPRKSAILSGYASPSMESKLQAMKVMKKGPATKGNAESPKAKLIEKRRLRKESPSPSRSWGDRGLYLTETPPPVPLGLLGLGRDEARNTRSKRLRIPTLERWRNESVQYRRLPGSPMPEIAGIQLNLAPRPEPVPLRNLGSLLQVKTGHAVDRATGYEAVGVPAAAFQSSIFTLPARTSKAQERSVRVGPALGILYVADGSIQCHMEGKARTLKTGDTLCFNDIEKTAVIEPADDAPARFRFVRVSS